MDFSQMSGLGKGYQGLHASSAWLDLSSRGKIRVAGEDRARLLHAMTTNNVRELKTGEACGQGCYAFFLNAQGRILGDANLFCFEDHLLVDTEPETLRKLYEHLDRYIIADDVTLEDQTGEWATIAVEGPEAGSVLRNLGAALPNTLPNNAHAWTRWGERDARIVARVDSTGAGGFFVFVPALEKNGLIAALASAGVLEAAAEDARTVRIEHGRPRYGEEITERYLLQETGQLQAVSFSKGCYLGQEIVERVRSRAQIHRTLLPLEIESTQVPEAGAKLKAGDAEAGEIVSAAFSPRLGKVVAMAYVRTPFAGIGTALSLVSSMGAAPARVAGLAA
jgi:tRNA-modifying protein YgfZ